LAKDAEGELGIPGGEVQPANEAADFFFGGCGRAPFLGTPVVGFQKTTGAQGVKQESSEALEIGSSGRHVLLRFHDGLEVSSEFVEANSYGLTKVHGTMLFASGDTQEPMAVAEVFV
jgi:hypothetical protein